MISATTSDTRPRWNPSTCVQRTPYTTVLVDEVIIGYWGA